MRYDRDMTARAVLFDLGDTLIFQAHSPDEERLYHDMAAAVRPLLDRWGVGTELDLPTLLGELMEAVRAAQPERRARGLEVDGAFITRGAFAASGVELTPEQAEQCWRCTFLGFERLGVQLYPDTLSTLRRLRDLGLATAIVSNGRYASDIVWPHLADLSISDDLVRAYASSADMMRVKPRPEPFLRALERLGVHAGEAAFVGDDLDADVRGAKALGMTTVWKLNGRHDPPAAPEADHVVHDLWELFGLGLLPERTSSALRQESLMPHEDDNADRY